MAVKPIPLMVSLSPPPLRPLLANKYGSPVENGPFGRRWSWSPPAVGNTAGEHGHEVAVVVVDFHLKLGEDNKYLGDERNNLVELSEATADNL